MKRRKTDEHRAEMEARAERRAARIGSLDHTPDRLPAKHIETPKSALAKIAANKANDDRRKMRRLSNAAATAEGRLWKGT